MQLDNEFKGWKMSKSDDSVFSRINLLDNKDTIRNKIKAKTDSETIMGLEALDAKGDFDSNLLKGLRQ